jgi:4-cresol dehydrogenase (hydroxylating) flavoprotein subunit
MTPTNLQQAIMAWQEVLGASNIATHTATYVENITEYTDHLLEVVLLPQTQQHITQIVAIANNYEIPIFPFSTGKNWGQGSKLPADKATKVLVDLKGLNKIIEINEQYRYAIIEAGVTQKQLADALLAAGSKYMLPVTGSGKDTSIVGNMIDRGVTVFAHRNKLLLGTEIVLGSGQTVKTGYWHYFEQYKAKPFFFHAAGVGADLNGLFCQSNFGIITKIVVQLTPRRKGTILHVEAKDTELAKLFDTFRELKEEDILQDGMLITNKNDPRTTTAGRYVYTGDWIGFGSFNGSQAMKEAAKAELTSRLGSFCYHIGFIEIDEKEENLPHPYFRMLQRMYHGIPSDYSLETMAAIYGVNLAADAYDVDNYKQMPGFSVVLPAVPFVSEKILEIIATINKISVNLGVQAFHNFASMGEMTFEGYYRMYFDRTNEKEIKIAHQWNEEVTQALAAIGIFPYRLNNQNMPLLMSNEQDTFIQTLALLKKVLDPKQIIAPKKYNRV